MGERVAILLDGGFVKKKLYERLHHFPTVPDVVGLTSALMQQPRLQSKDLFRVYYYDAPPIAANDLVPDMTQKGVDIRIGLDIAWIALKHVADVLVLVTGDSDFVPVMKFARKEGLKVYLETLSHGVRRELKAHADLVF